MPCMHAWRARLTRMPRARASFVQNPNEGCRSDREQSPWGAEWFLSRSRIVGSKVEAVGRWGYAPSNRNFAVAAAGEAAGEEVGEVAADSEDDSFGELQHSASVSGDEEEEEEDEDEESDDDSASEEEFGGVDRMRCAEFTLLRLD